MDSPAQSSDIVRLARACATAIGVAGFAVLAGYSSEEVYSRATGVTYAFLQPLVFQCAQLAFAAFLLWPSRAALGPILQRKAWFVASLVIGLALAFLLNDDAALQVSTLLGSESSNVTSTKLSVDDLAFRSAFAHSFIWILHTAILAPLAENLIYRGLLFDRAQPAANWKIAVASLLTFSLAYFFNGGWDGLVFALQFGAALTLLRIITGSVVFPIIAHMVYGLTIEAAALASVLP
jgi:membrane protease YdiL (CAAX protease family)